MYSYLSNRGKLFLLLFSLLFIITCKKDEDSVAFVNASSNNEDQGYVEFSAGDYGIGSSVTFTAVPNEHFVFVQWKGSSGQTFTDNPLTVKIESDLNLVAEFEATTYEFNVATNGDGRVEQEIISTSARSTDIQYGSRVRLTAIPENEHVFFRWGGDISETDNPIEVDVLGSMNITGNFDFELINSLIGNWTFPTTNAQSARGVDSNSNKSNDCTFFGLVFKPDYTFILFYSGGQIDGEFELISNTEISLGNSGSISNIDISETAISFEINLTVGCSTSVSGERDESSEGDTDEEVTSFLEKVDGTYWKTAYTNTDGKEFAKYFKLNDSIPNSYVEILLVDIEESCIKSSFTSDNVSELRQNYINELSFFSSNYIDGENVTTQFVLSDDESLELSETYGILGGGEDRVSLLQSISESEYNEIKESALCGVDGMLPAPTPTDDPAGVISIFSDSYTNVSGLDTNPNWNQNTVVTTFEVAEGDSVLKYEGLNYQGTQFDETSVITKTHLHIDYYSDDATELKLFLISPGPKEVSQPLSLENKVLGRWMSADLELASFADVVDLCKVFQIKIEGNGTVYFDNIYFYGDGEGECVEEEPVVIAAGEGPDGPAPTPTDDASDVISIFGDTYTNISDVNMNPSWNQETQYAEVEIADGDKIVRYSNLNYQGIEYAETNVSGKSKLHIDYWTKDATELKFFLIGKTSSGGSTEKSVTIPVSGAGTWKNANIDLSEFNVVVDICKAFQFKIVGNGTVYFDNIYFYGTGSGECQRDAGSPASSAPTPDKDASEVISVYSNAYSDVSASTYSASWGNANFDGNFAIGSDNVLKYSALAFTGIEFASTFDISGKAYVHFDVWTPDNTTFNFKLVDYLSDGAWGSDNKEHEYTVSNLSQNQWTSVDIPLSDFTGLTSKGNIGQIVISAGPEGDRSMATVFIDNIYFYGTADTSNDSSGDSSNDDGYCEKTITHFGIAAETASAIKLSVSKQDANRVKVTIESADNDPVDELVLSGYPGVPITGSPAVSAKDTSVAGKISIDLTWNSTPPDDYEMNILWSKASFAGNWMFTQEDSPVEFKFDSSCGDSSGNDSQDQGGDNNASSDPAFTGSFGNATYDAGTNLYTFPSGAEAWAGFANENNTLYPFTFQYGGKITFNAATQGTDVEMNFKFEKNPHPDVDPSFSTSNITITGTDVNQYSVDIPVRPDSQTYSSWLMYLVTRDAGVTITDIAISVYTELPASDDGSCSINTSLSSGDSSQNVKQGSVMTDIVYDITTDCTEIIHLVSSSGLPTGISASISGNTLTISGTASDDVGTYNYSLVVDNHLEQTSSAPYRAATVSEVITGSINILAGPAFTGSFGNATYDAGTNLYTFPSGAEGWAGFANENNTLYPISLTHGGKITFTGSAAQDTSIRFLFENAPHPNNTPNHPTGNVTITTSNPTAYSVAIPAYTADANQTFSSLILYLNDRDKGVTLTDFAIETYDSADTTAPVITVAGDAQVTLQVGATYTDAGATAVDDRDGTITVVTTGANVDTSTPGTYTVTYTVGDLAGNQAQATRTVTVEAGGPLFTGAFAGATKVGDVYTFPSGADAWAGFAMMNNTLYPISLTHGGKITFTGSAAQDTSIRFLFENAPYPNNTPNHPTGNVTITTSNPTAYSVAIPAYTADANQTFSSFIMYVNERDKGVTLTDFAIETYDSADTTAPVITVAGDAQVTLQVGATYTDAGATAVDDRDGTITVVTTGANVDTSTPGTYTVTYTVGDLAGNQAQATRTVTVQAGDHSLLVRSLVLLKLEMYIPSHLELTHGQALQMITLICTRYH